MAASATAIEEFLAGPLVTWLATCVKKPETLQVYDTFFDGSPIVEVLLQIDPEPLQPVPTLSNFQGANITFARIKIFNSIIKNIKNVYEEELGQVVVSLPDCVSLGRSPGSETALEQFKLLLLLLLGCAVQGPTKEHFILKIKELPFDTQHDIVECIKQVTDTQTLVLNLDNSDQNFQNNPQSFQDNFHKLYSHIRSLTGERDKLLSRWMSDLGGELEVGQVNNGNSSNLEVVENNHLAVELADWKARLRKLRQELEEKTEILTECREELEHANALVSKLKAENNDLLVESRLAKHYRDEIDAMRERAERADRLEMETQRYREKLADAEFYKIRVEELREDNRVLLETREMLENQLSRARQRADRVLELESELITAKQNFNEILVEKEAAKERIQELMDENLQLQNVAKQVLAENTTNSQRIEGNFSDLEMEECNSGDNSLSEQLTNNAQARALKLELENKKLLSTIDSLREKSINENANKVLDLEKEKKKLILKNEQLQDNLNRLNQQNEELENLFKNAIQENRKLQDNLDQNKVLLERQAQDLQNEKSKVSELEKTIESLSKDKQRLQILCDTIKMRADGGEKELKMMEEKVQSLEEEVQSLKNSEKMVAELKDKIGGLEKENASLVKDVTKLRELLETKDIQLDKELEKSEKFQRDIQKVTKELENSKLQVEKLQEYEQRAQELTSQTSIYEETVSTLQKDLISEKLNSEKCKINLEKISLNFEILENDVNVIVEHLLNDPKMKNVFVSEMAKNDENVCEEKNVKDEENEIDNLEIVNLQNQNEILHAENAKLQVDISTLKSRISSLQSQQTALQLANSQLVAEKEELSKQKKIQNTQHDTLLLDQITLRSLHEQLTSEYEQLKSEQEGLKKANRDLRSEIRGLKETNSNQKEKITALEGEKESLKNGAKNLAVLRAEHSKLKDDFRNLFTASERLKVEYRNVQEELKKLRTESRTLRLGQTEMQGELNSTSDLVAGLHLENAKLQQKCDMLFEMNHSLDSDRRALMDHVSQLLTQYHSLLTHSLEDKQHYHLEEKLYTDKVNNLCRQKEKLEEKIMEHYRKLDNASCKKRGFGATLVRKVRKAGSDIISKVPSRNRRSWHEDVSRLTQSQFTLGGGSGESGGNDSDNSLDESSNFKRATTGSLHGQKPKDEVALRRSQRDNLHRNSVASCNLEEYSNSREGEGSLSLGSVGSRRTVYLSEDEPNAAPNHQTQPPLLVYNRISTVLGEVARPSGQQPVKENENMKKDVENSKETAVWYEYGCV